MERAVICIIAGILTAAGAAGAGAQSLRGSSVSMTRQNAVAQAHDYSFLQSSSQVRRFVSEGYLVRVPGNSNYTLAGVSHPVARPAVKTFVERLGSQYKSSCGEKLVVTSLTRPVSEQPGNASELSVHPAGMAIDMRISRKSSCRRWLEGTLLSLEKQRVLDVTRESRPAHYHVALFPSSYTKYVATVTKGKSLVATATPGTSRSTAVKPAGSSTGVTVKTPAAGVTVASGPAAGTHVADVQSYKVARGESLWSIARRFGTTVDTLKSLNGFKSAALVAGQVIAVPASANGAQ
jgi:LysM repeat protein